MPSSLAAAAAAGRRRNQEENEAKTSLAGQTRRQCPREHDVKNKNKPTSRNGKRSFGGGRGAGGGGRGKVDGYYGGRNNRDPERKGKNDDVARRPKNDGITSGRLGHVGNELTASGESTLSSEKVSNVSLNQISHTDGGEKLFCSISLHEKSTPQQEKRIEHLLRHLPDQAPGEKDKMLTNQQINRPNSSSSTPFVQPEHSIHSETMKTPPAVKRQEQIAPSSPSPFSQSRIVKPPSHPYAMCSQTECMDRETYNELSSFECTPDTHMLPPSQRKANPILCIKKYRRSAAGGGITTAYSVDERRRSIDELEMTVEYLLGYLLPQQRSYPISVMAPRTMAETASFIDDRLRAVQVDLSTLIGECHFPPDHHHVSVSPPKQIHVLRKIRTIQAQMVRYGIVIRHLLRQPKTNPTSTTNTKYEHKFTSRALRTSMVACLDVTSLEFTSNRDGDSDNDGDKHHHINENIERNGRDTRDEVMSYAALLHAAAVLRTREMALPPPTPSSSSTGGYFLLDEGSGYTATLALFGKYCPNDGSFSRGRTENSYPKYTFALKVASLADEGNYNRLLRLLASDGIDIVSDERAVDESNDAVIEGEANKLSHKVDSGYDNEEGTRRMESMRRWKILCRMCMGSALNVVRVGAMRQYNKCFGKEEKVSGDDLARLLHLPTPQSAVEFCKCIGLPTGMDETTNGSTGTVTMKAAPISIQGSDNINRANDSAREDDEYIFGVQHRAKFDKPAEECAVANNGATAGLTARGEVVADRSNTRGVASPMSSTPRGRWADEESSDEEEEWEVPDPSLEAGSYSTRQEETVTRVDEDGVAIPPPQVIWELIQ